MRSGAAKQRATFLHLALAHRRGRLHLRRYRGQEIGSPAEQAQLLAVELARLAEMARYQLPSSVLDEAWRARLEVMLQAR